MWAQGLGISPELHTWSMSCQCRGGASFIVSLPQQWGHLGTEELKQKIPYHRQKGRSMLLPLAAVWVLEHVTSASSRSSWSEWLQDGFTWPAWCWGPSDQCASSSSPTGCSTGVVALPGMAVSTCSTGTQCSWSLAWWCSMELVSNTFSVWGAGYSLGLSRAALILSKMVF